MSDLTAIDLSKTESRNPATANIDALPTLDMVRLFNAEDARVPQAVATLFNLIEGSEESLTEKLIRVFRPKTILLILDNCEHMLDACAHLANTFAER